MGAQTPKRCGVHHVTRDGAAVLHDAITGAGVMKQKIAVRVDDFITQGFVDNEGTAIEYRACRRRANRRGIACAATG
jgi:hypothetical protein